MRNSKKEITPQSWVSLKHFNDEITHQKIHRHLTDINDTITDDDIRNIKLHTLNDVDLVVLKDTTKQTGR